MKKTLVILLALLALCDAAQAQNRPGKGYTSISRVREGEDSLTLINVMPVPVYGRRTDNRKYRRLVEAVKKVYPIAVTAREKMAGMEDSLTMMPTRHEQQAYIRRIERDIKREYTPVLRKMTRTEGRILLKLITRETDQSAFEIVREFRGRVEAGVWQLVAKIFGHDLKTGYDAEGEDRIIEQIVQGIEEGRL
ncbi:MAG: DUF4294 domain-containing protein [Alistipes sp.]|nr:DUF4294 domain-containing protein [Alistipes sp.]